MCGAIIISSVTVYRVDAASWRWTCCSDSCEDLLKIKGGLLKDDGVVVECTAGDVETTELQVICMSPVGHIVPGDSPTERAVSGSTLLDETSCTKADREKGKCPVEVSMSTQPRDFEGLAGQQDICPNATNPQECFEEFWGVKDSCNNNWTPIYVFFIDFPLEITWSKDGVQQGQINARCEYPFEELQVELTNNNTFIKFIEVEAECPPIP
jgi:hypothetical protein